MNYIFLNILFYAKKLFKLIWNLTTKGTKDNYKAIIR